jgi:hypothetical protein
LAKNSELESAFDAAITEVRKSKRAGMMAMGGESAAPYLEKLSDELEVERARAIERGTVDREWFQKTMRWMVEWLPETELTLIAALGQIVRSAGK